LGPEHPNTLLSMNNLGEVYNDEGKYRRPRRSLRQALEIYRRISGPEHQDTLRCMANVAAICSYEGKYAQAGSRIFCVS